MTTKITFYILNNQSSLKERALYTCRLIEKAFANNHKIYIYTTNLEESQDFDLQLWTFSDISFIPHEIYNHEQNLNAPILIGHSRPPHEANDLLINLTANEIPGYQQFNQLIEVIPNDEHLKALARQRFQIYKKSAIPVEVFNIDKN